MTSYSPGTTALVLPLLSPCPEATSQPEVKLLGEAFDVSFRDAIPVEVRGRVAYAFGQRQGRDQRRG